MTPSPVGRTVMAWGEFMSSTSSVFTSQLNRRHRQSHECDGAAQMKRQGNDGVVVCVGEGWATAEGITRQHTDQC